MTTKNDLHDQFSEFFENFSGSNGRNRRGMRAVIDSFEIYTLGEKNLKLISSCSELVLGSTAKQKKIKVFSSDFLEMATFLACKFFSKVFPNGFFKFFFLIKICLLMLKINKKYRSKQALIIIFRSFSYFYKM